MKRHNTLTNKPFNRGDIREDGFFFLGYQTKLNKQGLFYEAWVKPDVWKNQTTKEKSTLEKHVKRTLSHIKSRAKKENIPFNLSFNYAMSIVTEECPALGVKLAWAEQKGMDRNKSPSLDKINPALGYVEGNVMWLSFMANAMKRDASKEQLRKFAEWILNGHTGNRKGINP
jgi:hypothetical protein